MNQLTPKLRRHASPAGAAPGTITVAPDALPCQLDALAFGTTTPATLERQPLASIDELPALPEGHTLWLTVTGLGSVDTLRAVGKRFNLHDLTLEDIAHTSQRPKAEAFDDYLFIVTRQPLATMPEGCATGVETQQLSLCLGRNFVLVFQETAEDVFEPVRRRLLSGSGSLRKHGADYLAYALLDASIDAYFPLLESYGEQLEELEEAIIMSASMQQVARIHNLKRNLLACRRAIWPQRDMLAAIIRDDSALLDNRTRLFLRDCQDHLAQLIDINETYREIAAGLVDLVLSSQSNRMNEVMKVLTIIATIFIPLSFIAGVYGMNFDTASPWNLPELGWRYGYPAVLLLMLAVACGLLLWFRHRGWIGKHQD